MKSKSFPIRLSSDIGKGGPLPHGGWTFSGMRSICHSAQIFWLLQEHKAELRSGGQGQDLPSKIGKYVAQDAAAALSGRQSIEPFWTLVAPDWSRAPVISPAGPGKSRARRRNDDSVKQSLLYLLHELVSLSALREVYPRLALDIDAQHLQVEAFCSAELLLALVAFSAPFLAAFLAALAGLLGAGRGSRRAIRRPLAIPP